MKIKRGKRFISRILLNSIGKWLPDHRTRFGLGKIGKKTRYLFAKNIISEIGNNATIGRGTTLGRNVILKNGAHTGNDCEIRDGTTIEGNNMMGPECKFYTSNHKFNKEKLIYEGNTEIEPITIKEHSWLGSRCIILPGVTVGKGATVGAGSVVTKDVPDYHLAAGNPAKIIKDLRK